MIFRTVGGTTTRLAKADEVGTFPPKFGINEAASAIDVPAFGRVGMKANSGNDFEKLFWAFVAEVETEFANSDTENPFENFFV